MTLPDSRLKPDHDHIWVVQTSQGTMVMEGYLYLDDEGEWVPTHVDPPGLIKLGEPQRMTLTEFILIPGGARTYLQMLASKLS